MALQASMAMIPTVTHLQLCKVDTFWLFRQWLILEVGWSAPLMGAVVEPVEDGSWTGMSGEIVMGKCSRSSVGMGTVWSAWETMYL